MTQENNPTPSTPQPSLPEGYSFIDQEDILADEIMDLRQSVGWQADSWERWQACLDQPGGVTVGVLDAGKFLIGMGRLTADPRHAVLCDLAVHPDHRGQGIGRAIITERLRLANERRITYLYTELEPTNSLRRVYENLGFVANNNLLVLRDV